MTAGGAPGLAPLPIRLRPLPAETAASYMRRLARANHLRPSYLRTLLSDPPQYTGAIRAERLAALSGRTIQALRTPSPTLLPGPGPGPGSQPGATGRRRASPSSSPRSATTTQRTGCRSAHWRRATRPTAAPSARPSPPAPRHRAGNRPRDTPPYSARCGPSSTR